MALADEIIHQRYQPATPSFLNAGRKRRGELVSCFLIQSTDDMNTIGRTINSALQLSRIGGGVGINLSNLRGAGDPIKHIDGAASGVVPVMKLLEDSFSYSNQLGQRQGAGVVYLSVFHPDIIAFLAAKKRKMPTRSTGLRRCHSALLFLISSTNWLRLTRICICLVHTTLNAFTVNLFHTWISLRNTTTWLQTTIFEKKETFRTGTRNRDRQVTTRIRLPIHC